MQLTIIPIDGAVYQDRVCHSNLNWEGTPTNIHALQYNTNSNTGWLEFNDGTPNEHITTLPEWSIKACEAWDIASKNDNSLIEEVNEIPLTDAQREAIIIDDRNKRLAACDWTQLPDVLALHDEAWATNWRTYRQALRDLTDNIDINNPVFPVPPL